MVIASYYGVTDYFDFIPTTNFERYLFFLAPFLLSIMHFPVVLFMCFVFLVYLNFFVKIFLGKAGLIVFMLIALVILLIRFKFSGIRSVKVVIVSVLFHGNISAAFC